MMLWPLKNAAPFLTFPRYAGEGTGFEASRGITFRPLPCGAGEGWGGGALWSHSR
jgi:hypothetical protein